MTSSRPFLNSPASGWKHDLARPNEEHNITLPQKLEATPNFIDDVYLELSTNTLKERGVIAWIGALGLLFTTAMIWQAAGALFTAGTFRLEIFIVFLLVMYTAVSINVFMLRTDIRLPRDEPLRFNRARRKIYVYHYRRDWKRPFSRKTWGLDIGIYDWDDLHAEACEHYGAMGTGGCTQSVMLSILNPGTRDVLHRLRFSHDITKGTINWEIACMFMQRGRKVLPAFTSPAKDRNNTPSHFNVFWRFAPTVAWPADVDLESRTAPGEQ